MKILRTVLPPLGRQVTASGQPVPDKTLSRRDEQARALT